MKDEVDSDRLTSAALLEPEAHHSAVLGLAAQERRKPLPRTVAGSFVRSTANTFGIGKLVTSDGASTVIEYFDTVGRIGKISERVPSATVRRVRIPTQTRCWFERDGVWQIGRVAELLDDRYAIDLPSQKVEFLPETDFYVRWDQPVADPIEMMIGNAFDSPVYYELRRPFIDEFLMQRSACQGITALSSSAVVLFPHQVDVVAKVLLDDRQHYLLADEVGLGKTVEAGLIIRQWLIDGERPRVVVAAPRFLVRQWITELREKFSLHDFHDAEVRVIAHEALTDESIASPTDIVVDEAHRLMPGGEGYTSPRFQALERITRGAQGVLLVSATPLLHNEASFLAMLHLLDPEVYRLDEVEQFRDRVKNRQQLALRLNGLKTATPDFLLRRHVGFLRETFPDDLGVEHAAEDIVQGLEDGRPPSFEVAVERLREHVQSTYRLYGRVLRNRRGSESTEAFHVRGRDGVREVSAPEPLRMSLNDWLDEWRLQILSDHGASAESADVVSSLMSCSGTDVRVLREALEVRSGRQARSRYLGACDVERLRQLHVSGDEQVLLDRGVGLLKPPDDGVSRLEHVVDVLGDLPNTEKAVIFTEWTGLAEELADRLEDVIGPETVARHLDTLSADRVDEEVERFRVTSGCNFLVCDQSAEAGRNFQWADQLVHVDLPLAPNRIERRVGRLDRYGRGKPVKSTVFKDGAPGSFADAWLDCLVAGFGVFHTSIASLQHPIDDAMSRLRGDLLEQGIDGIRGAAGRLPEELAREREDVESVEALESISEKAATHHDLYARVVESDARWAERQRASEQYISDGDGNLRFHKESVHDGYRRYLPHHPRRTPRAERLPLVRWDVLQDVFEPLLGRQGTYSRGRSLARPGSRLFGAGDPFFDCLTKFSRWDTRGQASAMWRPWPQWEDQPELVALRLDFIASLDLNPVRELVDESSLPQHALTHLAERYFFPRVQTVWLDAAGGEIHDEATLQILTQRYDRHRDNHLTPVRRWALDRLLPDTWEAVWRHARDRGEALARETPAIHHAAAEAVTRVKRSRKELLSRGALRRSAGMERADDWRWLTPEIAAAFLRGSVTPDLTLDAVGCVVVAPDFPDGWFDAV